MVQKLNLFFFIFKGIKNIIFDLKLRDYFHIRLKGRKKCEVKKSIPTRRYLESGATENKGRLKLFCSDALLSMSSSPDLDLPVFHNSVYVCVCVYVCLFFCCEHNTPQGERVPWFLGCWRVGET